MQNIDRYLQEARMLKARCEPYQIVSVIARDSLEASKFRVKGLDRLFDTEEDAVKDCKARAAGRALAIIIDDIPHELPDSDHVDTAHFEISEEMRELWNESG